VERGRFAHNGAQEIRVASTHEAPANNKKGESMGIVESVILAGMIAIAATRRPPGTRRWRLPRLLRPLKRRVRQQERTPRER
jgi:hypothetical protein